MYKLDPGEGIEKQKWSEFFFLENNEDCPENDLKIEEWCETVQIRKFLWHRVCSMQLIVISHFKTNK